MKEFNDSLFSLYLKDFFENINQLLINPRIIEELINDITLNNNNNNNLISKKLVKKKTNFVLDEKTLNHIINKKNISKILNKEKIELIHSNIYTSTILNICLKVFLTHSNSTSKTNINELMSEISNKLNKVNSKNYKSLSVTTLKEKGFLSLTGVSNLKQNTKRKRKRNSKKKKSEKSVKIYSINSTKKKSEKRNGINSKQSVKSVKKGGANNPTLNTLNTGIGFNYIYYFLAFVIIIVLLLLPGLITGKFENFFTFLEKIDEKLKNYKDLAEIYNLDKFITRFYPSKFERPDQINQRYYKCYTKKGLGNELEQPIYFGTKCLEIQEFYLNSPLVKKIWEGTDMVKYIILPKNFYFIDFSKNNWENLLDSEFIRELLAHMYDINNFLIKPRKINVNDFLKQFSDNEKYYNFYQSSINQKKFKERDFLKGEFRGFYDTFGVNENTSSFGKRNPNTEYDFIFGKFLINFFDILKQILIDMEKNYVINSPLKKRKPLIESVLNKISNNSHFLGYFNNSCQMRDNHMDLLPSEVTLNSKILSSIYSKMSEDGRLVERKIRKNEYVYARSGKKIGNCESNLPDVFKQNADFFLNKNLKVKIEERSPPSQTESNGPRQSSTGLGRFSSEE